MEPLLKQHAYPQWITLQLIDACNLRCKMCYEWGDNGAYHGRKTSLLKLDVIKKLVTDCSPARPYYALFGGEPMSYPWLSEAIALIRQNGSRVDMPTNGTFLKKKAEMLCRTPPNRIWVSLDGPREINDEQRGEGVFDSVQEGMQAVHELRESKGQQEPHLGYTFIVTPLTYRYIKEFVHDCVDFKKINHISIEFQTFVTDEAYQRHRDLFRRVFGVPETPCAKGMVASVEAFSRIDYADLAAQIGWVKEMCAKHNVYFVCYPKTIDQDNYRAYFRKDEAALADRRTTCFFPWMYLEIASNGDATPCHTFYDYAVGNVNEQSVLDIWRGDRIKKVRSLLREGGLFPICTGCARYYSDASKH